MATRPGWYPDPQDLGTYRWWNGIGWTSWRAASEDADPPPHGGDPRTVATVIPGVDRERRHTLRTISLAGLTVLLLIITVGVFGAFQRASNPIAGASTSPTAYGSPSVLAPDVGGELESGSVVFRGELEVQMPGDPLSTPSPYADDIFDDAVGSQFEIHPGWYVSALAGYLGEDVARPGDDAAAAAAVGQLALEAYYSDPPDPGEPATGPLSALPPDRAAAWDVTVSVDQTDLPTTSDELRVAVVSLSDGRQLGLLTTTSNDATPEMQAAIDAFWESPTLL